jgi:predicted nucleotide-binding protein
VGSHLRPGFRRFLKRSARQVRLLTTPTHGEWMSAQEARQFLHPYAVSARAICTRAHAGLIKARAKLFISQGMEQTDVEVPREFWWAKGGAALKQNWPNGDFETVIHRSLSTRQGTRFAKRRLEAFGVEFWRPDIEQMKPTSTAANPASPPALTAASPTVPPSPSQAPAKQKVFIGHGHSSEWLKLKDFLKDRLRLNVVDFESVSPAGVATTERLSEMLEAAGFAFLVLTGEDEQATGKLNARLNVIHEAGLFQGKLGFRKAILLKEDGCEDFSNVHGLGEIRFPKGNVGAKFEEVRRVLEREGISREGVESGSD